MQAIFFNKDAYWFDGHSVDFNNNNNNKFIQYYHFVQVLPIKITIRNN